jgi:hypothetical protein
MNVPFDTSNRETEQKQKKKKKKKTKKKKLDDTKGNQIFGSLRAAPFHVSMSPYASQPIPDDLGTNHGDNPVLSSPRSKYRSISNDRHPSSSPQHFSTIGRKVYCVCGVWTGTGPDSGGRKTTGSIDTMQLTIPFLS